MYLPAQTGWYDFYTGKYFGGGQPINAAAPYERIPLFVKEGSIIPVGPEIQYTGEKPADPITLYVYTGKDGEFTLYEDEGTNNNFEKGAYSLVPFRYNDKTKTLTIGERKGSFNGMLQKRTFRIVWAGKQKPVSFDPDATGTAVTYEGKTVSIKMSDK